MNHNAGRRVDHPRAAVDARARRAPDGAPRWRGPPRSASGSATATVQAETGTLTGGAHAVAPADGVDRGVAVRRPRLRRAAGDGGTARPSAVGKGEPRLVHAGGRPAARQHRGDHVPGRRHGARHGAVRRHRAAGRLAGPGALLPVTLPVTLPPGQTAVTATTVASGGDEARLDALMVEPLVSRLVLGRRRARHRAAAQRGHRRPADHGVGARQRPRQGRGLRRPRPPGVGRRTSRRRAPSRSRVVAGGFTIVRPVMDGRVTSELELPSEPGRRRRTGPARAAARLGGPAAGHRGRPGRAVGADRSARRSSRAVRPPGWPRRGTPPGATWCSRSAGRSDESEHEAAGLRLWAGRGTVLVHARARRRATRRPCCSNGPGPAPSSAGRCPRRSRTTSSPGCCGGSGCSRRPGHAFRPLAQMCEEWAAASTRRTRGAASTPAWPGPVLELWRSLPADRRARGAAAHRPARRATCWRPGGSRGW